MNLSSVAKFTFWWTTGLQLHHSATTQANVNIPLLNFVCLLNSAKVYKPFNIVSLCTKWMLLSFLHWLHWLLQYVSIVVLRYVLACVSSYQWLWSLLGTCAAQGSVLKSLGDVGTVVTNMVLGSNTLAKAPTPAPRKSAAEDTLVMDTKLKIIEILQASIHYF